MTNRRAGIHALRNVCLGVIVGALVLALAGCSSDSDDSTTTSTSSGSGAGSPSSLSATQWTLNDSVDLGVPTEGVTVTAEFSGTHIMGNGGCNAYNAPYNAAEGDMSIGPQIVTTRKACDEAPTAVERAYLERLPQVRSYKISGTTLTLYKNAKTALLAYDAVDGAKAILGTWTVTGFYTGNAIQSVVNGSTLTADFTSDEISGETGCNSFGGGAEITQTTIKLGPFRVTLKACEDPALQAQEQQYLSALELAATYSVAGDRLDLFRADGGIAVTLVRTGS